MRVINHPRVSSKEQSDTGDSIEFQEKRLREHSQNNGDEIFKVVPGEGTSASISDDKVDVYHKGGFLYARIDIRKRKEFITEVLDILQQENWDALKITRWDRFSRNQLFSLLMDIYFKKNNKKIISTDDSNDTIVKGILGLLGQEEINKSVRRVRDVRSIRFEKGMFVGKSPYGYKTVIRNKKVVGHEIHKKQAEIVKECFLMASKGVSYKEVCEKHGLKPQQYYNIIKNKAYIGIVTFEGKEKEGIHKPIISKELWEKINN